MSEILIRGDVYLSQHPGFRLVGRTEELKRLSAILMRNNANSVLLVGPGGVGCTSLCLGLQALKLDPNAPFDIINKRFLWLDTDSLFSSGDTKEMNALFQKALDEIHRTSDSVLIVQDTRDFVDAARSSGCTHFINALTLAINQKKTQAILEARDDDLDVILKCHSDLRDAFTLMDLEEPKPEALRQIVNETTKNLYAFHNIKISDDAIAASIELTSKYRTQDAGLSRAQPERSVTLLDRALANYRITAHERPPMLQALEEKLAQALPNEKAGITGQITHLQTDWATKQGQIKKFYQTLRSAEISILNEEDELAKLRTEQENRQQDPESNKQVTSFASLTSKGGFMSPEMREVQARIDSLKVIAKENGDQFEALTTKINEELILTRDLVLQEFSDITGIPADKLNENERAKLLRLESGLKQRIFGQDDVVRAVADGIKVAKLGRRDGKPLPFLFLGPSGVGKTEMAKAVAALLLDSEAALTRFDMSEYMEKHAVATLIGAPPGYEGFDVGGVLTNAMRKNPNRVLLFDEIEKAHPDVFNIFLQVLSDGRLSDRIGRVVSFGDAITIFTTNIGQASFLAAPSFQDAETAAMTELAATYRSEFLNRFNGRQNIRCFRRLEAGDIAHIVHREIRLIDEAYRDRGIAVVMSDAEIMKFCNDRYDPTEGARGLPGYIKAKVEPHIVNRLLTTTNSKSTIALNYDTQKKEFVVDWQ